MSDIQFNILKEKEQHKQTDKELINAFKHLNQIILITL
jgi:hypothetical protein